MAGETALLAAVGAGLGVREAATAALAAHALGADANLGAASVRFWGKLLGVHADYYVFEAALRPANELTGARLNSHVARTLQPCWSWTWLISSSRMALQRAETLRTCINMLADMMHLCTLQQQTKSTALS